MGNGSSIDTLIEMWNGFFEPLRKLVEALNSFSSNYADVVNQVYKRLEQLRISKSGWDHPKRPAICAAHRPVVTISVAAGVRKVSSATGM